MNIRPHTNTYTRLRCSKIHGVGVFAIRDISKGTLIFSDDDGVMVSIDKNDLKGIEPELKKLYDDFCIIKGDEYKCPRSFNCLTVGWYINESRDNPNVKCTEEYDFVATRDIMKDEELLANYSTYSEYPEEV